jgi:3-oxoacyl-[acyl-carrier-protein] synthase II
MTGPVLVTGYGIRTVFGAGAAATRDGVFAGRPAFTPVTRFDPGPYRSSLAATGPVAPSVAEALAESAGAAVTMAALRPDERTGVFAGTAGDFVALRDFWRGRTESAAATVPAWQAGTLAARLGAGGPRLAFTNACVAAASAIIHACRLIAAGRLEAAVCAGAYLVEEENFAKFSAGRALSRDGRVRPFSADRSGLLLGDGAAAIVLESPGHAGRRGAEALAAVTGWGEAADAHHIAKPHPDGAGLARALGSALRRAGASTVDYVNAHGTGTPLNDPAETRGLSAVLGERAGKVPVSSTKGATGHLLEAAGAVEFVITLLALLDQTLPPTSGFTAADPECALDCIAGGPRPARLRRAVTINAAFGGANTAIVLEQP